MRHRDHGFLEDRQVRVAVDVVVDFRRVADPVLMAGPVPDVLGEERRFRARGEQAEREGRHLLVDARLVVRGDVVGLRRRWLHGGQAERHQRGDGEGGDLASGVAHLGHREIHG